jgi:hypothetical protein
MNDIDYNEELIGFIESDKGISLESWVNHAGKNETLVKKSPIIIKNPFTGEPVLVESTAYSLMKENKEIGLFVWEEGEFIGVAGNYENLEPEIKNLSQIFGARFEKNES